MIKLVNVNARIPVRNVTPPIHGYHAGIKMGSEDILKCLSRRAIVDEILDNGKTLRLTMKNYYTNNNTETTTVEKSIVDEKPVEELVDPIADETPVVEEPLIDPEVEEVVEEDEIRVEATKEVETIEVVEDAVEEEVVEAKPAHTANVSTSTPSRSKKRR